MTERLRWWVIPGAVVVMLRIVTLDAGSEATSAKAAVPAATAGTAVARDAIGQRSHAMLLSLGEPLVLQLPSDWAGQRVSMRAWRRIHGVPDSSPWFTAAPRVRSDATLPISGMQAGRYDVEIVAGEGTGRRVLRGSDLAMPGTHELSSSR